MSTQRAGAASSPAIGASARPTERELVLFRTFAAPRALVFAAWTKAEHFARWFGPKSFSIPTCELEPRPGGAIRFCMGPDGAAYWHEGAFREVVEPERLVFTLRFTDGRGAPVPHPHFPDWPVDAAFVTTVTFADDDGGTRVTVHQVIVPAEAATSPVFATERPLAREGWGESFERLDALLARVRAIPR